MTCKLPNRHTKPTKNLTIVGDNCVCALFSLSFSVPPKQFLSRVWLCVVFVLVSLDNYDFVFEFLFVCLKTYIFFLCIVLIRRKTILFEKAQMLVTLKCVFIVTILLQHVCKNCGILNRKKWIKSFSVQEKTQRINLRRCCHATSSAESAKDEKRRRYDLFMKSH